MSIVPCRPVDELTTLRQEMDSLWDRLFPDKRPHGKFLPHEWLPSVDLNETKEKLIVKAELPGLEAKDVELSFTDDVLTIKGEHLFFVERHRGSFKRQIRLPALVKTDKIDAHFDKGVLTISLPKTEEAKKKEIKIKVS